MSVKASVSEENGEISCTIAETNRIRAVLGLKPLRINASEEKSKEQIAVDNFKKNKEETLKNLAAQELQERIEKARNKRLLNSRLAGSTLADVEDDEDTSLFTAADWVKRSRTKEILMKEENERKTIDDTKSAYSVNDLKGLKVMHSAQDFEAGQEVILTLADSNILETDETTGKLLGIRESDDILENVNMTEEDKRKEREKKKQRLRQPLYSAYDDDEFAEGLVPGTKPNILAHYDYDKQTKIGPKFEIGTTDISTPAVLTPAAPGMTVVNLNRPPEEKQQVLADYYSKAEYAAVFKKVDKPKKERKLRKRLREEEEEDGPSASLDHLLTSGDDGSKDRGTRVAPKPNPSDAEQIRRMEGYQQAVKTAALRTQQTFGFDVNTKEFEKKLAAIVEKPSTTEIVVEQDRGAKTAIELIQKQKNVISDSAEVKMDVDSSFDEIDAEGRRKDGRLVFSSTTEFSSRLQSLLNEKARSLTEKAVEGDLHHKSKKASSYEEEISKKEAASERMELVEDDDDEDDEGEDDMEGDEEDDAEIEFLHRQPLVSNSTAATLALLKASGELQRRSELAGRANDEREEHSVDDVGGSGVKIEYRDEYGRNLTKKEAFRQLSYRFHGYGPGKKKKDKRLKAMILERNAGTSLNATDSVTMKSLQRAQEATGKAHIVIQGAATDSSSLASLAATLLEKKKRKEEKAKK